MLPPDVVHMNPQSEDADQLDAAYATVEDFAAGVVTPGLHRAIHVRGCVVEPEAARALAARLLDLAALVETRGQPGNPRGYPAESRPE